MKKYKDIDIINRDNEGNVIENSFPVSERTKKDQRKTSVGFSLVAFLLHVLAIVPIIAVSAVLAVKTYNLTPYYSFWCFIGVIVVGVFGLLYAIITLIVTRKKSKSSIGGQTAKVAITFVCLTCVFSLLLTYIVPDIIAMATQNTMFVEDLYYNGESQAEKNAKLDRDFIMYNVLAGNLNDHSDPEHGDYSYKTLSKRMENDKGALLFEPENGLYVGTSFYNEEINASFLSYLNNYSSIEELKSEVIEPMAKSQPRKYELYQFIYNTYVLNDFDYAFFNDIHRPIIALSILDYEYSHAGYEELLKEGFSNKKVKDLFDKNFDSFNQDGYQTFDDPLLLYAQMPGRMTVPVVLRLILNEGWMHSQPVEDEDGNIYFTDEGNCLYEIYDPATRDAFLAENGPEAFKYTGTLMDRDGVEKEVKYGFNEEGWMVFENGVVKRTINWLVLDMDGNKMDIANVSFLSSISGLLSSLVTGSNGAQLPESAIKPVFNNLLSLLRLVIDSAGELVQDDLQGLIEEATNGSNINIGLYIDDDDNLAINIYPMNTTYGMIGYAQASWVQSNNLLMAVINVISLRNWLSILGAVGTLLVIAAGVVRECGRRTRLRTEVSRDRIIRAKTSKKMKDGEPLTLTPVLDESKADEAIFDTAETAPTEATSEETEAEDKAEETTDELHEEFDRLFDSVDVKADASEETTAEELENLDTTELTTDEQTEEANDEVVEEPVDEWIEEPVHEVVEEPVQAEEPAIEENPVDEQFVEEQAEEFNHEVAEEQPVEEWAEEFSHEEQPVEELTEEPVHEVVEELPLEEVTENEETSLFEELPTDEQPVEEQSEEPILAEEQLEEEQPVEEQTEEPIHEVAEEQIAEPTNEVVEEPVEEKTEEPTHEVAKPANQNKNYNNNNKGKKKKKKR